MSQVIHLGYPTARIPNSTLRPGDVRGGSFGAAKWHIFCGRKNPVNNPEVQARLRAIAEATEELEHPPELVMRAINMCKDPRASASDLAELILRDPAATMKILRLANSAFYSLSRRVPTVTQAIVVLGLGAVRNLLMTSFYRNLHHAETREADASLWRHAVLTAVVARELASSLKLGDASFVESAYVGALIHDVGRLILHHREGSAYPPAGTTSTFGPNPLLASERATYGFTHAELGAELAHRWYLPYDTCDAILHHHSPGATAAANRLASVVHIADYLAERADHGPAHEGTAHAPDSYALHALGWTLDELHRFEKRLVDLNESAAEVTRILR